MVSNVCGKSPNRGTALQVQLTVPGGVKQSDLNGEGVEWGVVGSESRVHGAQILLVLFSWREEPLQISWKTHL